MKNKIVARAVAIAALMLTITAASFAQTVVQKATVRRVAHNQTHLQPVAASYVAMKNEKSLNLSNDQQAKVAALNAKVEALHIERDRLWKEYREIKARPDFNDAMAAAEIKPRMLRIVAINTELKPKVVSDESQMAAILNSKQRDQLVQMMSKQKAAL